MLHSLTILSVSGAVLVGAEGPQTPASSALAALSGHFVCPEALPNDDARRQASRDFLASYESAFPSAAASGANVYRHVLLKTHACREAPPPRVTITIFHGSNGAPFVLTK
jgi:hypothetical protein